VFRARAYRLAGKHEDAFMDLTEAHSEDANLIIIYAERAQLYSRHLNMNKLALKDIQTFHSLWGKKLEDYESKSFMQELREEVIAVHSLILSKYSLKELHGLVEEHFSK